MESDHVSDRPYQTLRMFGKTQSALSTDTRDDLVDILGPTQYSAVEPDLPRMKIDVARIRAYEVLNSARAVGIHRDMTRIALWDAESKRPNGRPICFFR